MIICGNVCLDQKNNNFFLQCILCESRERFYTKFLRHIKTKHKDLDESLVKSEGEGSDDEMPLAELKEHNAALKTEFFGEFADEFIATQLEEVKDPILALHEELKKETEDIAQGDCEIQDDIDDNSFNDFEPDFNEDPDFEPGDDDVPDAEEKKINSDPDINEMADDDDEDDEDKEEQEEDNKEKNEFMPTFFRKKRYVNEFIDAYKAQSVLWDLKNDQYNDSSARETAEQAIIDKMKKYKILMEKKTLGKALRKLHKSCILIKNALDNQKPVIKMAMNYYKKCNFLNDYLENQKHLIIAEDEHKLPLKFKDFENVTKSFIETYGLFPVLYDHQNPLYGRIEDKEKALDELQQKLLKEHSVQFDKEKISNGIDQLTSWYYKAQHRRAKTIKRITAIEDKYFKKCLKFMPAQKPPKQKFTCSHCPESFSVLHKLQTHLFRKHQVGQLPFPCEYCGKGFDDSGKLRSHIQRCHTDKSLKCDYCEKLFSVQQDLIKHIRIHNMEKPYICELCGKSFRLRHNLTIHTNAIHTNLRAFKCTLCPKDFKKNSDLKEHIKAHLNIRDKICETCGKGFSSCHSLIRHRQIHSLVPKFECKMCDRKFKQFVGLNSHMKRHHNIVRKPA